MSDDEFEMVHGSGNVFRDFGEPNAEVLQLKAFLAAKVIAVLDDEKISVRQAHEMTGFAAADFSRVRQAKLQRFTLDRLIDMLGRLGQEVDVQVSVRPRAAISRSAPKRTRSGEGGIIAARRRRREAASPPKASARTR
jgi:predicted XRE-type DNA-binding protein